jgi:hypothetical protein
MNKESLKEIASKYVQGNASTEESELLHQWYDTISVSEDDELVVVTENIETADTVKEKILNNILTAIEAGETAKGTAKIIPFWKRNYVIWVAAASMIAVISTVYISRQHNDSIIPETAAAAKRFKNDVLSGSDKAILVLANGKQIVLDSSTKGMIAQEGNTKIYKRENGQLTYLANESTKELVFNKVITPKGGQYHLVLPDGSNVWLNAASSIHFPTAFNDKERKIEISGEAYFEVAKDQSRPFKVAIISPLNSTVHSEVEVMGTHFNINSYANEKEVKTTLLEGSIKFTVAETGETKTLSPGQQVILNKASLKLSNNVDLNEVVAWHNNLFKFKELSIEEIMKQVERWYDVEVVFEGGTANSSEHFISTISRGASLVDFLGTLETTGRIHFKVEGKKVTVIP